MKKTKLFTSLAALALVLGLGACDVTSEDETTPDESETTTETTDTSESTSTTPSEDPDGYVLVGDFIDSNWDAKVDTSSKYYIPLGTTEYKATVTIAAEPDYGEYEPWAAGLRVVEWGDSWNLVVGSDELDEASTGVTGSDSSKNIKVNWGETYDITIAFGDTNSILVTVHEDSGNEGGESETIPGTNYAIGESYWFGYEYSDKLYSFTGAIQSTYYGAVATDTNDAVSVTLGQVEGGYTLAFNDSGTKSVQYIKFVENGNNRNFSFTSEPFVWEYNATYDTFVALDSTSDYVFIGNYYGSSTTYDELRASSIGYLDGTKSSDNTQYPAHLYAQDTPTTLTITGGADSLEIDKTLKLGITTENGASHDVVWTSSNEEAAVIDEYGEITGLAAADEVTITATSVKSDLVTASITLAITEKSDLTYKASETINTSTYYSYVTASSLDLNDVPIYGDLVTISFASNGGSTAPQYYVNGTSVRIYAMNTMTFTPVDESVAKISSIEINYDGTYYGNDAAEFTDSTGATAGSISNPKTSGGTITLTVSASGAVTYTNWVDANHSTKSGGTQIRILSFTIYYAQA